MSMQPAPTFCTCPPLSTGAGSPIARSEPWEHQRTCPMRHPLTTFDRIASARVARGLPNTDARRVLIELAIEAGYDFAQIGAMLRSGIGDEGPLRVSPTDTGDGTLLERAMRDA